MTSSTGTGLVHTSPAHGIEDFDAYRAYQISLSPTGANPANVLCAVDAEGRFSSVLGEMMGKEDVERLVGKEVLGSGIGEVIEMLVERKVLLKEVGIKHKYPYDWRTKKPVIFRSVWLR